MALPAPFLEELRARSPLPELIGRRVRLTRSGRQWKGCCPFHDEKTPSFYVYDDHFHCFGCGAHGDAISFVMQSQGLGFMEAVGQLAAAAGLTVPQPSPEESAAEQARQDLFSVLEAAANTFSRRLFLPEGKRALEYLTARGLTLETIRRFGLGWSGEGRGALAAELAREGIAPPRLAEAGLLKEISEKNYSEFFFNRVMFPIRDQRGRVVSFGGRMLGDGQPKYLNGPETSVFAKRRALYGLDQARERLRSDPPILVEGYMDVIALHQAGFPTALAPLGTALSEEQLAILWRHAEAPVICFDGDAAGARAAERAITLALPLIGPGRTLTFAALPEGEDPDSLLRRGGAGSFRQAISNPEPLFRALYRLVRSRTGEATPEQRALLRAELEAAARRIGDANLAREYRRTLLDLSFASRAARPAAPVVRRQPAATASDRPRQLVAVLIREPRLLPEIEEEFPQLALPAWLDPVRAAILQWAEGLPPLDSAQLIAHLHAVGLAAEASRILARVPLPVCPANIDMADARARWREIFDVLVTEPRLKEDVDAAARSFERDHSPERQRQVIARKAALDAVRRGGTEDAAEGRGE
jgi:DNA primase